MHHLNWEMLSLRVMNGYSSIYAARNKQVTVRRISKLLKRVVELAELVSNTSSLYIKNPHNS